MSNSLLAVAGPFAAADRFGSAGLLLSAGVIVVSLSLFLWQAIEERRRQPATNPLIAAHDRAQTARRRGMSLLMLINGVLIAVGTSIPHQTDGRPNMSFVVLWACVFGLVLVLLAMALIDWAATRCYAQHARADISREGMAILRDELERRAAARREADMASPPASASSLDLDATHPHTDLPSPRLPRPSDN